MSEEQKLILEMLSQGKISVEEAQRLLETVGMARTNSRAQTPGARTKVHCGGYRRDHPHRFGAISISPLAIPAESSWMSNIPAASGSEAAELELDVRNVPIRIESWDRDEFRLDVIKDRAGTEEQAEALISAIASPISMAKNSGQATRSAAAWQSGQCIPAPVLAPEPCISGQGRQQDRSVEVGGIDTSSFEIHTMNGSVRLNKVSGNRVLARTVNGSLRMEGGMGQVDARTTNGSITLINIAEDSDVNLETVNGRILVQLPIREDIGVGLSARTTAGSVRLEHPCLDIKIDSRRVTGGAVSGKVRKLGSPHRMLCSCVQSTVALPYENWNEEENTLEKLIDLVATPAFGLTVAGLMPWP